MTVSILRNRTYAAKRTTDFEDAPDKQLRITGSSRRYDGMRRTADNPQEKLRTSMVSLRRAARLAITAFVATSPAFRERVSETKVGAAPGNPAADCRPVPLVDSLSLDFLAGAARCSARPASGTQYVMTQLPPLPVCRTKCTTDGKTNTRCGHPRRFLPIGCRNAECVGGMFGPRRMAKSEYKS